MGLWQWMTGSYSPPPRPAAESASADVVGIRSPYAGDTLGRITFDSLFPGVDPDSLPITRAQAMRIPSCAASRHRVVGTLSRLPMKAEKGGTPWVGDADLLEQPDPGEPHVTTMARTLDDLLFDGRAYWLVVDVFPAAAGELQRPRSVVQVPAAQVNPCPDTADGQPRPTDEFLDRLLRFRGLRPLALQMAKPEGAEDNWTPPPWLISFTGPHAGLLDIGVTTLNAASSLERSARSASANPVPGIELHQITDADLDDAEVQSLIESWRVARRNGGIGYTNSAIELKTHGTAPENLLIDGRNQSAVDMARLVGIPAASIDAGIPGTALTYANLQDRLTDLINLGLSAYAVAITGRLSMNDCLPRGVTATFSYTDLYPVASSAPATAPSPQGAP